MILLASAARPLVLYKATVALMNSDNAIYDRLVAAVPCRCRPY